MIRPDPDRPMYYVLHPDHTLEALERDSFNLYTWADYMENRARLAEAGDDPWLVGRDHLPSGYEVSTVFLGLDHNMFGFGPPLVFETMLFGPDTTQVLSRYPTWQGARAGHERFVYEYGTLAKALGVVEQWAKEKE